MTFYKPREKLLNIVSHAAPLSITNPSTAAAASPSSRSQSRYHSAVDMT